MLNAEMVLVFALNPRIVLLFLLTHVAFRGQKAFLHVYVEKVGINRGQIGNQTYHGLSSGAMTSDLQGHSRSKVKDTVHDQP